MIRTIAVNLFPAHSFASIPKRIRLLAHDIHRLFSFNESALPQGWGIREI